MTSSDRFGKMAPHARISPISVTSCARYKEIKGSSSGTSLQPTKIYAASYWPMLERSGVMFDETSVIRGTASGATGATGVPVMCQWTQLAGKKVFATAR